jgi:hydrogenase expression/formation protein HypC
MCLAIPGKIISISEGDSLMRTGQVSFGGTLKEVNLVYVPVAKVDNYVIVHVGFAISVLNEEEAHRVFDTLNEWDALDNPKSDLI